MGRRLQPWVAHPKGTTPQAMAATLRRSAHSFETLHPVHYFLARVPLVRVRSRCQWVAACSNPKTYYMRPVPSSMFFLTISCSRSSDLSTEEHTSELQSPCNLVCRLLLEKKKKRSNGQTLLLHR